MSAPGPPPPGGNYNRGPEFMALSWAEVSVASTFVSLRFYTRIKYSKKVYLDDWIILFTLILMIVSASLWTVYSLRDGGRHVYYLTPAQQSETTKFNWISQGPAIMAVGFGKISVGVFLLRILGPDDKWQRLTLYFVMITSFITASGALLVSYIQCSPVSKLWNPFEEGHCWAPDVQVDLALFFASYLTAMDFALATIPIWIVWNLHLSKNKKIGLAILLGCGSFSGVSAAIKTSKLPTLSARSDFTSITVTLLIWTGAEIFVTIVAACVPTLRPLFIDVAHSLGVSMRSSRKSRSSRMPYASGEEPKSLQLKDLSGVRSSTKPVPSRSSSQEAIFDYGSAPHHGDAKHESLKTFPIRQTTEWTVHNDHTHEQSKGGDWHAMSRGRSAEDTV
ncbi:hypothetical protein MMC25_003084 [Agyrium rufum]|nr:hypothetical protein [Agyrium rufum]